MRRFLFLLVGVGLLAAACEEGPEQIYSPNPGNLDLDRFNGLYAWNHAAKGDQKFEYTTSGEQEDTVKLCEADETAKRWAKMVKEPIKPTIGAGGLDLRGEPMWSGLTIDDAQQMLCQAYVAYSDLYYWGDNAEVIARFNPETRIIDYLVLLPGYEGTIKAGDWEIALNKPLQFQGKKVADPYSDETLRKLNRAIIKAFRPEVPNPDSHDCIATNSCRAVDVQTDKRLVFNDLGMEINIEPEEQKVDALFVGVDRTFDITKSDVKFTTTATSAGLLPIPTIQHSSTCQLSLGKTWSYFTKNCIGIEPPDKALTKSWGGNEGVSAALGTGSLIMIRPGLKPDAIIPEKAKPEANDVIIGISFGNFYQGKLGINRTNLFADYFYRVKVEVEKHAPTVDMAPILAEIKPDGDASKFETGIQWVQDCTSGTCKDGTLTIAVRKAVEAEVKKVMGYVPDKLKDPNTYVEHYLLEILRTFNDGQYPGPTQLQMSYGSESAINMYATLLRTYQGKRYQVNIRYANKEDDILFGFYQGELRPEKYIFQDAKEKQYTKQPGDGIFRLWNLVKSPRLGLGNKMFAKTELKTMRKALVTMEMDTSKTDVLVNYLPENTTNGFYIPIEGKRSLFVPAASFGFSGLGVGATFYADGDDGIIKAISSSSFFDKLEFCGIKVGLWDDIHELIKKLPSDCAKILSYSENGKILYGMSTYVEQTPYKVGLRLYCTAGRIDGAYYWAEE